MSERWIEFVDSHDRTVRVPISRIAAIHEPGRGVHDNGGITVDGLGYVGLRQGQIEHVKRQIEKENR